MTNTNCLQGVRCPACGNEDVFHIEITASATVTDNGAEVQNGDYEWNEHSFTQCAKCDEYGELFHFQIAATAA